METSPRSGVGWFLICIHVSGEEVAARPSEALEQRRPATNEAVQGSIQSEVII